MSSIWDERYAMDGYLFGTQPNAFLLSQQAFLKQGTNCLAVADGEGRNGVWLAEQGLRPPTSRKRQKGNCGRKSLAPN